MRHRKAVAKLGVQSDHRRALYRSLMIALIEHRKITTTVARAKALQPKIEQLITIAREDTPHARQVALSRLASKVAMRKLFTFAPQEYATRNGGYTRITKIGPRFGDAAEMAVIELI